MTRLASRLATNDPRGMCLDTADDREDAFSLARQYRQALQSMDVRTYIVVVHKLEYHKGFGVFLHDRSPVLVP